MEWEGKMSKVSAEQYREWYRSASCSMHTVHNLREVGGVHHACIWKVPRQHHSCSYTLKFEEETAEGHDRPVPGLGPNANRDNERSSHYYSNLHHYISHYNNYHIPYYYISHYIHTRYRTHKQARLLLSLSIVYYGLDLNE